MSISLSQYKDRDRVLLVEAGRLHPAVSFTRASTATVMNGVGALVQVAANVPRFEYSAAGGYLGLLIEEARTNLLTYSDGDVTTYPGRSGVTGATTPLATYFSNSVQFPSTSGTNYAYKQSSVTSGTTYTLSIFVKMDDNSAPVMSTSSTSGDMSLVLFGNIQTVAGTIINMGGNIYRLSVTQTAASTATTSFGVVQYASQSHKGFRVTGYQWEVGASMTSYIPTTTVAVTRSGDLPNILLSAIGWNATEGMILVKFRLKGVGGTKYVVALDVSGRLLYSAGSLVFYIYDGTTPVGGVNPITLNAPTKIAAGFSPAGMTISTNGTAVATGAFDGTFGTGGTTMGIGQLGGSGVINGWIEYLAYSPKKRLNADFSRLSV